jgi:pyruvate,orthophosphate dikinase
MGVDHHHFEEAFDEIKKKYAREARHGRARREGLIELCDQYKTVYQKHSGRGLPAGPASSSSSWRSRPSSSSWNGDRAIDRTAASKTSRASTAPRSNVQSMAYGNMGDDSGTGVAFTRNPVDRREHLLRRVPRERPGRGRGGGHPHAAARRRDAQVEQGGLQAAPRNQADAGEALQGHAGHRVHDRARHAVHAADPHRQAHRRGGGADRRRHGEGEAHRREDAPSCGIPAGDLTQLLLPSFDQPPTKKRRSADQGHPRLAGRGDVGKLAFTAAEAVERAKEGENVLLVRKETSPRTSRACTAAAGILTSTGGRTSHAAVVACGWGKCCVVGAGESRSIDQGEGQAAR